MTVSGERHPTVESMFPEDLKEYMERAREGSYLLLDVRQPEEYEQGHLPGARSIPLPELTGALAELKQLEDRDVIVYCEVGGRSLGAAQFLAARGVGRVRHLIGGVDAWEERTAAAPIQLPFEFLRGDESPVEAARIAYRMEDGMERLHRAMMERTDLSELKELLSKLVKAEQAHKSKLTGLLEGRGDASALASPHAAEDAIVEGGARFDQFMRENEHRLASVSDYLDLAMMTETQALDLYLRMADACADPAAREVFFRLSDEEKHHLAVLGAYLGKTAGPEGG